MNLHSLVWAPVWMMFPVVGAKEHLNEICCILRGPSREHILDGVPRGKELRTQVKTGSQAGRTHSQ